MEAKLCSTTKRRIDNDPGAVIFPCPECGKEIVRCSEARSNALKYTCSCGFVGPN